MLPVETPFKVYTNLDGLPLDNGYVYFGTANANPITSPVTVFWDAAGTQPVVQPVRTVNGYIYRAGTPANVFYSGDYSVMVKDSAGRQVFYARTSADFSVNSAIDTFINSLSLVSGAGLVGFSYAQTYVSGTIGWGLQTVGNSFNILRLIPPAEWPAIANGTSTYDVTAIINTALANYKDVWMPPGVYSVNPDVGIQLVTNCSLHGAGMGQSILAPVAQGGTTAELAAYTKGSVIKRAFTPGIANARVNNVHLSDFAVVMNHPTASVTTTEIQIALDMRNVGRTNIERVHVGNIAPIGGRMVKADPGAYAAQGYGIVFGTVASGDVAYCGGEVGVMKDCLVYGAFKCIVMDDIVLSPLSGAHAIKITGCDIQGGHHLLVQEQQYTAGFYWDGNVLQNVIRQPGNATPTYVMRIAGYDNKVEAGYIEAGVADHILRFDSASANNRVQMQHYSASSIGVAAFSDVGRRNRVPCNRDTGSLPGGIDSKGIPIVRYDRSYEEMWVVAHWDGAAMVIDGGFGLTPTRPTTAGDYLFTFDLPVLAANGYSIEVSYDTNASGHGGTHSVISHTITNVRIQFYAQNGGTSTAIDPRFVFVRIKQL